MKVFSYENLSLEWLLVSVLIDWKVLCLLEALGHSLMLLSGQSGQPVHLDPCLFFSNSPAFISSLIPAWQGVSPPSTTTQWPRRTGTPFLTPSCLPHTPLPYPPGREDGSRTMQGDGYIKEYQPSGKIVTRQGFGGTLPVPLMVRNIFS